MITYTLMIFIELMRVMQKLLKPFIWIFLWFQEHFVWKYFDLGFKASSSERNFREKPFLYFAGSTFLFPILKYTMNFVITKCLGFSKQQQNCSKLFPLCPSLINFILRCRYLMSFTPEQFLCYRFKVYKFPSLDGLIESIRSDD